MYQIFITKLVSEVNRDMDTINAIIKLGFMVYQLIFLLLDGCNDCNCGEYSLKIIFLIYPAHLELHSTSCQVELYGNEYSQSHVTPSSLIQCATFSSSVLCGLLKCAFWEEWSHLENLSCNIPGKIVCLFLKIRLKIK